MSINKESLNHRVEAILKGINTVLRKEKITIVDDTPCMFHLEQTQDNPHIDL